MCVADGNGQGIRRIVTLELSFRHQDFQHHVNLLLFTMPHTDDSFFHGVRRIFEHRQTGTRRNKHGDAARLSEFQRGHRVLVDESLLHSRLIGLMAVHDFRQAVMKLAKPGGEIHVAI